MSIGAAAFSAAPRDERLRRTRSMSDDQLLRAALQFAAAHPDLVMRRYALGDLSDREELFVYYFIETRDATAAARKMASRLKLGTIPNSQATNARYVAIGARYLRQPSVAKAIADRLKPEVDAGKLTVDELVTQAFAIAKDAKSSAPSKLSALRLAAQLKGALGGGGRPPAAAAAKRPTVGTPKVNLSDTQYAGLLETLRAVGGDLSLEERTRWLAALRADLETVTECIRLLKDGLE
jgi:hypothetical protein